MKTPSAILFDLGDTLFEVRLDIQKGRERLYSLTRQAGMIDPHLARTAEETLGQASQQVRIAANYEIPCEAFHRNLFDLLGLTSDLTWEELDLEFFKASHFFRLEDGVLEALQLLKAQGIRMGIISNSFHIGRTLEWMCHQGGIMGCFEFLMSSADYGFRKPHPQIFETAVARLGLPREEVWFIGDRLEFDIIGAKDAGLTAVWYNADGAPDGEIKPDLTISGWRGFMTAPFWGVGFRDAAQFN